MKETLVTISKRTGFAISTVSRVLNGQAEKYRISRKTVELILAEAGGRLEALADGGFDGYVRPDHGRNIWGEDGKPGYGLYDRALGACYLSGLFEAVEKSRKR
mgnify:CR=1 FL=1